jgi:hypothetical protein
MKISSMESAAQLVEGIAAIKPINRPATLALVSPDTLIPLGRRALRFQILYGAQGDTLK